MTRVAELLSWIRAQGPAPRLTRHTIEARGLAFAVYMSPPVPGVLPLVCVNGGLLFSHTLLWPALAPLARTRQLILYDQRGRGLTPAPPGWRAARIEHDAGDLPALRQAMGIDRWDVLGHSWGGGIAMLATAQDQRHVRRLVTVDAVGPTGDWLPRLHERALARLTGAQHAALAACDPEALREPDIAAHVAYAQAFYPAWFTDPELASHLPPPKSRSDTGAAVAARLRREGYDWRAALATITTPTLVLHGTDDVLPIAVAGEVAATLRRARLQALAGAGHNPFWEAAPAFHEAVVAFLEAPETDRPSAS